MIPKEVARPNPKEVQKQTDLDQRWYACDLAAYAISEGIMISHKHNKAACVPNVVVREEADSNRGKWVAEVEF
jgi:hypothetical protein